MIEQGLYFGLGFVVAGLVALGFMPVLWARAIRLTRRRLQVQIPVSMQEILADRDQLRARFAVERRRLEQEMERVRATKAKDMSALGHRTMEAAALTEEVAALTRLKHEHEGAIARLERDLAENEGQRGALQIALDQTTRHVEQRLATLDALRQEFQALEATAEERRGTVAALHTRVMGLEMTIEDLDRTRAALERQHDHLKETMQLLTDERDLLSTRVGVMQSSHDSLRKRLASEAARATSLTEQTEELQANLSKAETRLRALETELAAAEKAVRDAKEREKTSHIERSLQAERVRGDGRATLDRLEALQADNAALRGALEAARRQAALGQVPPGEGPSAGEQALRASIHELGLAVARLATDAPHARPDQAAEKADERLSEPL